MKDRVFWEMVYRGLMMIAKAIKLRHLSDKEHPIEVESQGKT